MSEIRYFGNQVSGIVNLPIDYQNGYYTGGSMELLEKKLRLNKSKYSFAITADKFQGHCFPLLKKFCFKKIITFKSSHNRQDENLTLWVNSKKKYKKINRKKQNYPWNCSVGFGPDHINSRFCFLTNSKEKTKEFQKVKNVPFYFKVHKKHVAKHY